MRLLSVLLVEENALFRHLFVEFLPRQHRIGAVHVADNGDEAVAQAVQTPPDVVLIGLFTPSFTGLDTLASLRKLLPKTYIVALSTRSEVAYSRAAIDAGADAFVDKMRAVEQLPGVLRRVRRHPDTASNEEKP